MERPGGAGQVSFRRKQQAGLSGAAGRLQTGSSRTASGRSDRRAKRRGRRSQPGWRRGSQAESVERKFREKLA